MGTLLGNHKQGILKGRFERPYKQGLNFEVTYAMFHARVASLLCQVLQHVSGPLIGEAGEGPT